MFPAPGPPHMGFGPIFDNLKLYFTIMMIITVRMIYRFKWSTKTSSLCHRSFFVNFVPSVILEAVQVADFPQRMVVFVLPLIF